MIAGLVAIGVALATCPGFEVSVLNLALEVLAEEELEPIIMSKTS